MAESCEVEKPPERQALSGKVALVTGIGPGLGSAVARRFSRAGASVVVAARSSDRVRALAEELGSTNPALAITADVSIDNDLQRLVEASLERFGHVDVVFNNAHYNPAMAVDIGGQATEAAVAKGCLDLSRDDWTRCLEVNVVAPYRLAQLLFPKMRDRGGSIVTVSSNQAATPAMTSMIAYGSMKAAVEAMTRFLARELAPTVRVNTLCPGAMTPDGHTPALFESVLPRIPLGRIASSGEVAEAALFLASDASSYMTGELLRVDGGRLRSGS